MDRILMANKTAAAERAQNQTSLFAGASTTSQERITLREVPPASSTERLTWEKELLGLFVSGHPYEPVAKALGSLVIATSEVERAQEGAFVRCGGIITTVKVIQTKKNETMAFVGLEDLVGKTEVIVFPRTYVQCKDLLVPDAMVVVSAKVSKRDEDDGAKLLANSFVAVSPGEEEGVARMLKDGMWVPGQAAPAVEKPKAEDPYAGTLAQKPAPRDSKRASSKSDSPAS
jgi:DNA polymerase-3 subunit alpha